MCRVLIALLLFVLLAPLPGSQLSRPHRDYRQTLVVRPMADVSSGLRFGALTLAEAWEMTSAHSQFGGLSGMALTGNREFLMISDSGYRLRFGLGGEGQAQLGGYVKMPPPHPGYSGKFHFDAEAVTLDPATGRYWTAMEGTGEIWCFEANDVLRVRTRQTILDRWPDNGGAEVLTRLPDGRFVALSERTGPSGKYEGVLFSRDPADRGAIKTRFFHDPGRQGVATDAAALPDGRLIIIYRKLGLWPVFTTSIALADTRGITAGATLTSTPIAVIRDPRLAENYEGAAISSGADGLSLWLVSDDNLQNWQRNRLLRFRIDPAALITAKRAEPSLARP
jgi:hypothetical protein